MEKAIITSGSIITKELWDANVKNPCSEVENVNPEFKSEKVEDEKQMFYELVASGMSSREAKRKLTRMAKRKKK